MFHKTKKIDLSDIPGLYQLGKEDIKDTSFSLGDAFSEDPLMTKLVGGGKNKKDKINSIAETFIKYYLPDKTVYATSGNLEGVIIVTQGNLQSIGLLRLISSGVFFIFSALMLKPYYHYLF